MCDALLACSACAARVENCGTASHSQLLKTVARPPRESAPAAAASAATAALLRLQLRCLLLLLLFWHCPLQPTTLQTFWVWVVFYFFFFSLVFFFKYIFWLAAVCVGVGRCQKGMKLEFIATFKKTYAPRSSSSSSRRSSRSSRSSCVDCNASSGNALSMAAHGRCIY